MKKIQYLALGIGLFALVGLITCNKATYDQNLKCTDANTIRYPQHAKDYFLFKEGTWWLYKNLNTGETDSQWVQYSKLYFTNEARGKKDVCRCENGKCYEIGGMSIVNMKYQNPYSLIAREFSGGRGGGGYTDPISTLAWGIYETHMMMDSTVSSRYQRMNYRNNGATYDTINGNQAQITILDSITVQNNTFNNILFFDYTVNGSYMDDWFIQAWFAKNIGTIKYISSTTKHTWVLIDYHIVQ